MKFYLFKRNALTPEIRRHCPWSALSLFPLLQALCHDLARAGKELSDFHPIVQMRKLRTREKQLLLGCSTATGVRGACEAASPDGVAKEGEQKGTGRPLRGGGRVLWNPCTHQVAPRLAPGPPTQLLTLGGLLSCLGTPHLGKHLLSRAPHQGQVGIDADLRILPGVLVQVVEHGPLPRAKRKPSPRAHPEPTHPRPGAPCPLSGLAPAGAPAALTRPSQSLHCSQTRSPVARLWDVGVCPVTANI